MPPIHLLLFRHHDSCRRSFLPPYLPPPQEQILDEGLDEGQRLAGPLLHHLVARLPQHVEMGPGEVGGEGAGLAEVGGCKGLCVMLRVALMYAFTTVGSR